MSPLNARERLLKVAHLLHARMGHLVYTTPDCLTLHAPTGGYFRCTRLADDSWLVDGYADHRGYTDGGMPAAQIALPRLTRGSAADLATVLETALLSVAAQVAAYTALGIVRRGDLDAEEGVLAQDRLDRLNASTRRMVTAYALTDDLRAGLTDLLTNLLLLAADELLPWDDLLTAAKANADHELGKGI